MVEDVSDLDGLGCGRIGIDVTRDSPPVRDNDESSPCRQTFLRLHS